MANIKPVVLAHQRRADGTFIVKIRVTHKGKVAYIPTNIVVTQDEVTRSLKIKQCNSLLKSQDLARQMVGILSEISPFALEDMDVKQVAAAIVEREKRRDFSLDFFAFAEDWLSKHDFAVSTSNKYRSCLGHLKGFAGAPLDINSITKPMLQGLYASLPTPGTVRYVHIGLQTIFKAACARYNNEDEGVYLIRRRPFSGIDIPDYYPIGQRPLTPEQMQALISFRSEDSRQQLAADMAVLSFCLMGMNLIDLYKCAPPVDGILTYRRSKTQGRRADGAEMQIRVPAPAMAIASKYAASDGAHWLNLSARNYQSVLSSIQTYFPEVCSALGFPRRTFYSVRKAWATIARSIGIEKALVDECLAHVGDYRLTDIYAQRDFRRMWEANEKVLSLFSWGSGL